MGLDRSMENLIQSENDFFQSVNSLEAQMIGLINIVKDRNEETLHITFLTIVDYPDHIDRNEESWCIADFNQESIPSHKFELHQFQTLDKLLSFSFNEIEFNVNVTLIPNLVIQFPSSNRC